MITVWVPGVPRTKGSMEAQQHRRDCRCKTCARGGRGVRLVQSVDGSERWAALVADVAARAWEQACPWGPAAPMQGPMQVTCVFWMPVEDVTAPRTGDVDKLARNVLDALTKAKAYGDDVQVVSLLSFKLPMDGRGPGLLLRVQPVDPAYAAVFDEMQATMRDDVMRRQGLLT